MNVKFIEVLVLIGIAQTLGADKIWCTSMCVLLFIAEFMEVLKSEQEKNK